MHFLSQKKVYLSGCSSSEYFTGESDTFYEYICLRVGAYKCWSGCATECLRSHPSGELFIQLLLLGAQKNLEICCASSVG